MKKKNVMSTLIYYSPTTFARSPRRTQKGSLLLAEVGFNMEDLHIHVQYIDIFIRPKRRPIRFFHEIQQWFCRAILHRSGGKEVCHFLL